MAAATFLDRTTPPTLGTLILVTSVPAMSMTVFLPSLPSMAEDLGAEYRVMQLAVALYLLFTAILHVILGPVSDRLGRRPVILASYAIFLIATLGCLAARSVSAFLVFRMLQGVIVAGIVLSRAIIRDVYPADRSASMIAYVTMGMAMTPMLAPALGGALESAFGWRASFWMLFVSGLAVMALAWRDAGETLTDAFPSFSAQFREFPELFRSRRFWGYCGAAAFTSGTYFAYLGGAPFVGADVFGLDPAAMGLLFGATAVGYFLGNFASGRYSVRVGIDRMILFGTILAAGGMLLSLLLFVAGFGSALTFFGCMIVVGVGIGLVLPNATAGMLSVRPRLAGTASGFGGAAMIGGGALLAALAGSLLVPGRGAYPLLLIQLVTALLGVVSILFVIRREQTHCNGAG